MPAADLGTDWCEVGGGDPPHSCETGLLSGTVTYAPDPVDPPTDGTILLCCAQPADPISLDL